MVSITALPSKVRETDTENEIKKLKAELTTAVERAEAAERSRDDVLAIAGHEMRTPLTALLLHLQSIERLGAAHPDRVFTSVELAQRMVGPITQLRKLTDMLDRLLDTSRIRSASVILQLEPVDISLLLGGTVARFEAAARAVSSKIELVAPDNVIAYVDSMRLEQVLSNLMSNAIKYGNGSKITLRLRTDSDYFYIDVEDRGLGIAKEDQERVFQRYERASGHHRGNSLGLGLYIMSEIVKSHDGTVSLESEPGRGSTFTVKLPLRKLR